MKVLITGSTGLIGSALITLLKSKGFEVSRLVRRSGDFMEPQILWNPKSGYIEKNRLEGFDAVVHLAGESIAAGRWTESRKIRIKDSRSKGTEFLSESLTTLSQKPKVFISASAIGYYGNRDDEILSEKSPCGSGFLAEVCSAWENASKKTAEKGIRVVNPRIGMVLSSEGGALAKMLTPFKFCLGGVIGNGSQYMSWISIDDLVEAIYYLLINENIQGPVNLVSPNPVTNSEFTKTLGHVLNRATLFPVPSIILKIIFGEMAEELLLSSCRVKPELLLNSGYKFKHPKLKEALEHLLGGYE